MFPFTEKLNFEILLIVSREDYKTEKGFHVKKVGMIRSLIFNIQGHILTTGLC